MLEPGTPPVHQDIRAGERLAEPILPPVTSLTIEQTLCTYYSSIDEKNIDMVLAIFSEDAVYNRAGEIYSGKQQIDNFFRHERKLDGVHSIERIIVVGVDAFVVGEFTGVGESSNPKKTGFIDYWTFSSGGAVTNRTTALVEGSQYVLR